MANPNNPAISFLVPYRWFNEDKEFLGENLNRMIEREVGRDSMSILDGILTYKIVIAYYFREPVDLNTSKTALQRMLKKSFPNAKCLSAGVMFKQNNSYKIPTCDFQIFF